MIFSAPADQGPCGLDKGRSPAVEQNVKSPATPCVAKLDRKNWFLPPTLNRSSSVKHGLAKPLTLHLTARDRPPSKPHGPWPSGVGGP